MTAGETAHHFPQSIMPTIAEIIAARAKKAAAPTPAPAVGKPKALVLTQELPAATPQGEPRGQRTPITTEPERSLCDPHAETIPCTPTAATSEETVWHTAMQAPAAELCLVRDPSNPEVAWLALRPQSPDIRGALPLLLHQLPLWDHPQASYNQPF